MAIEYNFSSENDPYNEREAVDPDDLAAIKANNAELAQLEAQEKMVKDRHAQIMSLRKSPPFNPELI